MFKAHMVKLYQNRMLTPNPKTCSLDQACVHAIVYWCC